MEIILENTKLTKTRSSRKKRLSSLAIRSKFGVSYLFLYKIEGTLLALGYAGPKKRQ